MAISFYIPAAATSFTFLLHAADDSSAEGVLLEVEGSQETFGDQGLSYIYRSAMQSDGRVVFPCYDGDTRILVKCYQAGSLTVESWATYIAGSAHAQFSDIAILNNGNIVVSWTDNNDDEVFFAILSPEGSIIQGTTDGTNEGEYSDYTHHVFVLPLEDGGFCLVWTDYYDETLMYASLWEADGTLRQATTFIYGGEYDTGPKSAPIQMPSGGVGVGSGLIITWEAINHYSGGSNTTDLSEEYSDIDYGYGGNIVYAATLPEWTDKIAHVSSQNVTVYGNINDDDINVVIDGKTILSGSGWVVNSFLALPDNTFLLQATSSSDYGLNYWILDANLDIVSGPTVAFAGLTANNSTNIKGAAITI